MNDIENQSKTTVLDKLEFEILINNEFKPKNTVVTEAVNYSVKTLAEYALMETELINDDIFETVEAMIASIDQKLTEQINLILHTPEFQQLEGAWRGLHHLVNNTETDEMLKIRVMNISKTEAHKTLKRYKGAAWDQSPLFKKLYEEEYGQFGGEPYGCLIADYSFDNSGPDVELLAQLAQIASAIHSPLIAAADPAVMLLDSWRELANPRDLSKLFQTPEHMAWRNFRESEDSRYIGLTLPRVLARAPYGQKTNPVDDFAFEEDTSEPSGKNFTWTNSAYAMGVNINKAFKEFGWCSRIRGIESGGAVEGLPVHIFPTDDGGVDITCPTEIAISDRREAELSKNGFIPLIHKKNTDFAAFIGAQSLHKPAEYDDPEATANAALAARLPFLFATCRFAHYLKCIVRDKIGGFKDQMDMSSWLNDWVRQYVEVNPATASDVDKARRPLADANVIVEELEGSPGYYSAKFYFQPHHQLEGLTVSLRLVSKIPVIKS